MRPGGVPPLAPSLATPLLRRDQTVESQRRFPYNYPQDGIEQHYELTRDELTIFEENFVWFLAFIFLERYRYSLITFYSIINF